MNWVQVLAAYFLVVHGGSAAVLLVLAHRAPYLPWHD